MIREWKEVLLQKISFVSWDLVEFKRKKEKEIYEMENCTQP